MHDDRRLVEQRLDRVLKERVQPAAYAASVPLELSVWQVPDEPVPVAEALRATYEPFAVGQAWGRPWSTSWFRAVGSVPAQWAGRRVEAVFDLGFHGGWPGNQAEALVYDATGRPLKGVAPRNQYVPLGNPSTGAERVELLVEAAANPDVLGNGFQPTPLGDKATAGDAPLYRLVRADLAVLDEDAWHLGFDMEVLAELMAELAVADPRRHDILRALERAMDVLDVDGVAAGAARARELLAPALAKPAHASAHTLSAVGHAHIDSAWLWPLRETMRKASRTFANVTALAAEYPELVFACSQAQQYAWVRDRYPEIFQRMREAIKAGQWAPVGGMWVEADGILPGGEALARQLVHGKRFFLDEFGVECEGVWLPDSFGYTAAYPQLARLAGMRWFLTQKLSWNDTNTLPHHTFWWEGIDGSRVFTHFPPVDTYNASFRGAQLAHAVRNYAEKGGGTRSLVPFGHGDGGGGPTREMLEKARRLRDLEGSARVVIEDPDTFFRAAQAEYANAPVWSGELYLELHRATYTTQARTKAGNRRSEHLLRDGRTVVRRRHRPRRRRLPVRGPGPALENRAAAPVPRHPAGQLDRVGASRGGGDVRAGAGGAGGRHRVGDGGTRLVRRADLGVQRRPVRAVRGGREARRGRGLRDRTGVGRGPARRGRRAARRGHRGRAAARRRRAGQRAGTGGAGRRRAALIGTGRAGAAGGARPRQPG